MDNKNNITFWNIRRGFATNSSSSHSMLLLEPGKRLRHKDENSDFGWDNFTLVKKDSKVNYLTQLFGSALSRSVGESIAKDILKDLGLAKNTSLNDKQIDHQSHITLPLSSIDGDINLEFIKELSNWILKDDVAILGGNDNSEGHPATNKGFNVSLRSWLMQNDLIAWKDNSNNTWSLFSKLNGLALRFSFDDIKSAEEYNVTGYNYLSDQPSSRPNLVDIKITDSCPFACSYCYQGSTPNAPHASLASIINAADKLSKESVFEVAMGGGEPTLHPDFKQIIDEFDKRGITPNFTTRNLAWIKNKSSVPWLNKIGSFAISVDNAKSTQQAIDAIKKMDENIRKYRKDNNLNSYTQRNVAPSIQVVVGTQGESEFKDIIRLAIKNNIRVTLLGYKTTGFGAEYMKDTQSYRNLVDTQENWIDWVVDIYNEIEKEKKSSSFNNYYSTPLWINIDTVLAQISNDKLEELEGGRKMYHTVEGSQSMYIDAVTNTMAPSSFAPKEEYVEFDDNWINKYNSFSLKDSNKNDKGKKMSI